MEKKKARDNQNITLASVMLSIKLICELTELSNVQNL